MSTFFHTFELIDTVTLLNPIYSLLHRHAGRSLQLNRRFDIDCIPLANSSKTISFLFFIADIVNSIKLKAIIKTARTRPYRSLFRVISISSMSLSEKRRVDVVFLEERFCLFLEVRGHYRAWLGRSVVVIGVGGGVFVWMVVVTLLEGFCVGIEGLRGSVAGGFVGERF